METSNEELLALRDKANLALGFALLQSQRAAEARPILERVRLEGPYSSMALLGVGWADSSLGQFKRALVPWLELRKRNLLDSAVQESYLTVPYAYNQLGAGGQAAEYYSSAIESFDAELKRIDDSIAQIRSGNLLDRLLNDDKKDTLTWYWQLKTLPDAPESRYLYQLLATNEFQEGLKNYRELHFMSRNLDDWRDDIAAFNNMLDTRQQAYNERVPKADAVMAATDLDALTQKRVDFESRINEIEKSNDVAALGTPEEQRTWVRLKRIEDFLAHASRRSGPGRNARQASSHERSHVLAIVGELQGETVERAPLGQGARGFAARNAEAGRTGQTGAIAGVPTNTGEFAGRVAAAARAHGPAAAAPRGLDRNSRIAICRLSRSRSCRRQKQRIETYQVQARFELAAIYDKAANPPAKPKPKAQP